MVETPFVGLRPFDQGDRQWFRGREKEAASLTRLVRTSPFTAVVGGSGTGKSSLVRAGVLPQLTEQGWRAIIAKPGAAPIERLAQALAATDDELDDRMAAARRYRFDSRLRASAFGLAEIERSIDPAAPQLVLVIDQFEELFRFGEEASGTARAAMREESRAYVELLLNAASGQPGRLRVVITMRSDFFGECSAYAGLAEAVSRAQYLVPLPSRDQLEKAIREPIAARGAAIDEPLVQRLLIDVEEATDRLPTLQHTLRRLWEEASGEPRRLSEAHYLAVGKLEGSIDQAAERVTKRLVEEHAVDQDTLERVMKALTLLDHHDRATRRPKRRSALFALIAEGMIQKDDAAASLDRVLKALSAEAVSFLAVGEGADPEVDIGHEALIRGWRRLAGAERTFKTGWLREEYQDGEEWRELLRRAASDRLLWPQDWLRAKKWLESKGLGPAWTERHGNGWAAVQRFRRRSLEKFVGLALSFLLVFGPLSYGGLFWAWQWRADAQRNVEEALRFARAGALATAGYARSFAAGGDSRTAALVALAVLPESRVTGDDRYLPEVEAALADALSRPFESRRLLGHGGWISSVAFSPDGRQIVSGGADGTLRRWDAGTGAAIGEPLTGHGVPVYSVAFSPDGRQIVSGSADGTVRLWEAGYLTATLAELAERAESLCPLTDAELRRLRLLDRRYAGAAERALTDAQRMACGEPVP